jgi:hypothetical protein
MIEATRGGLGGYAAAGTLTVLVQPCTCSWGRRLGLVSSSVQEHKYDSGTTADERERGAGTAGQGRARNAGVAGNLIICKEK